MAGMNAYRIWYGRLLEIGHLEDQEGERRIIFSCIVGI
jgi:hypothetical protein